MVIEYSKVMVKASDAIMMMMTKSHSEFKIENNFKHHATW